MSRACRAGALHRAGGGRRGAGAPSAHMRRRGLRRGRAPKLRLFPCGWPARTAAAVAEGGADVQAAVPTGTELFLARQGKRTTIESRLTNPLHRSRWRGLLGRDSRRPRVAAGGLRRPWVLSF